MRRTGFFLDLADSLAYYDGCIVGHTNRGAADADVHLDVLLLAHLLRWLALRQCAWHPCFFSLLF